MATGLVPGLLYAIVVDTLEVGIVTADEEGQAGLELHAPAEEDALPDALQPVDNIRTVEWFEGELLILSGVFSGESDSLCHELKGWFAGLTEDGFVLKKGAVEVEIVVTDDTEFEGFDDLGDLEEGDRLEVEVCADGERIVARSVELEDRERECGEFRGTFAGLTDDGFMLLKGDHELEVTVTDETELEGFDDLGELEEGDRLEVEGCWDGERFVARSVERDEHELECFKVRGEVIELTGDGFVLQAGEETVEVVITEETTLYRFESLEDLEVGDEMMAFGCFDGGVLVAKWAKRIVEDHCAALRGVVGDRTDRGFALQVGDDLVEVAVTDETVLRGFASLDELDGGEMVVVEGCFEGDVLVAVWIKLIEDDDCVEVRGVVLERNGDRLWVEVGDEVVEVVVTDETWFKEFESLEELDGGEVVVLEGCFEGEVLVAKWIRLLEDDDEPEWWEVDGTVVGFLDNGIVLSADGETIDVVFTEDTDFVDYENADQIAEGDVVFVEGPCDGEVLIAARVVLIEHGA
jgi:hypothetical protein